MKKQKANELKSFPIDKLIQLIIELQEENEQLKAELAKLKKSRPSQR